MFIKIFIVTYNNIDVLNNTLKNLFQTINDSFKIINVKIEINIINNINNHSDLSILDEYKNKVNFIHNSTRHNFSTGHLSRSWNKCIINGFKDLNNPDCDILVTMKNDCIVKEGWIEYLIELHKKYSFIQFGTGDEFMSYLPEAVKKIGLWDERFYTLQNKTEDYFLRAFLKNKDTSSINDHYHFRLLNNEENKIVDIQYEYIRSDINNKKT